MKRLLSTCAAGALVVGGSVLAAQPAQAAEPPSYSVMLLQPHSSGSGLSAGASGLNNRGDVVGDTSGGLLQEATLWSARSGMGGRVGPVIFDSALDISGDGEMVGYMSMGGAVHWKDGKSEYYDLRGHSTASRISENGVAAVNEADENIEPYKAYTATTWSNLTELLPPDGMTTAQVEGISDDGRGVAGIAGDGEQVVPVVWTDGTAKQLTVPGSATILRLTAVNNSGHAVGCSGADGAELPLAFDSAGEATALPVLSGHSSSCATAINNAGVIVGYSATTGGNTPTVWFDGQAHDLNDLVPNRAGYTLGAPNDINASGQIVGTASLPDGTARGYIATPSTAETIYTAPGTHHFNGRDWKTNCEPYSQTTRCRTEIIATQVVYNNGSYSRVSGWAFNNLTYTPSPRSIWANNPLGNKGEWTANDGRKWRTECDTPATGKNGCRSYVFARVADATPKPSGGYAFSVTEKWVFNNIVKFS